MFGRDVNEIVFAVWELELVVWWITMNYNKKCTSVAYYCWEAFMIQEECKLSLNQPIVFVNCKAFEFSKGQC